MSSQELTLSKNPEVIWTQLIAVLPPDAVESLTVAYDLASRAHQGQTRKVTSDSDQIPYIVHPLRVARIIALEWERRDFSTIATCLLHDSIEDGAPDIRKEIERAMGKTVYDAVLALTKPKLPEPCPDDTRAARDARYFNVLRHTPEWVRLIKCADRVDNLRDARAWGNVAFWTRYSSETIGWHLYLARETSPLAEVALFTALVEGEREIRGRVPVWADGRLIDPLAARLIPEHVARHNHAVGMALRGNTLVVGMRDPEDRPVIEALTLVTRKKIEPVGITSEAIQDALNAGLFGRPDEEEAAASENKTHE